MQWGWESIWEIDILSEMSALKWSKVSENNWLCHFKRDNPLIPPRPTKFYCPRYQTSPKPRKLLPYSCLKCKRSFYKNFSISWQHNTRVWRLPLLVWESWTRCYNSRLTFPSYFTCQHLRVITGYFYRDSLNPWTIKSWPIRGCYYHSRPIRGQDADISVEAYLIIFAATLHPATAVYKENYKEGETVSGTERILDFCECFKTSFLLPSQTNTVLE